LCPSFFLVSFPSFWISIKKLIRTLRGVVSLVSSCPIIFLSCFAAVPKPSYAVRWGLRLLNSVLEPKTELQRTVGRSSALHALYLPASKEKERKPWEGDGWKDNGKKKEKLISRLAAVRSGGGGVLRVLCPLRREDKPRSSISDVVS
jgi:hypothetical protein